MNKLSKGMLVSTLLISALGTATAAEAAGKKSVILLSPTEECAYCADYVKFFRKEAEKKGLDYTITTSPFDPANQANQVEQAIAKHPDAIVLWPVDASALVPSMRKIKKAGIPLVISDATPLAESEKYWDVFTGGNSVDIGKESAKAMVDAFAAKGLGKEGKIFAITGTPGTPTSINRMKGFKEELAAIAPGIEIVGEQPGNWDQSVATNAAATLFTRFGADIKGVYAVEDVMMAGVIVAAQRAAIKPESLALVGVGCEVPGYHNIEAGLQYATVLSDALSDARYAVDATVKLLNGEPQEKYTYIPNPIVTKSNLAVCSEAIGL
ncbi:LacI family transcriptional regulator [Pokkaliibacter plantistimulans]|uniref:LacI family transcriptional regulator n=1 Tax=Proteobacteria bacterium 228 TaxID=2083153 RepID=A0A2S5KWV6_9PROT|nr:sugar ABC transporter substrate-binding protein [Pokkaliibacter plantistimulans]PPC79344.1 LacI family transcriptional regulator [Pokkaliibacter plantistimulans]